MEKIVPETAHNKSCGFVEKRQCCWVFILLALWAPQVECHLIPYWLREGGHLCKWCIQTFWWLTSKQSNKIQQKKNPWGKRKHLFSDFVVNCPFKCLLFLTFGAENIHSFKTTDTRWPFIWLIGCFAFSVQLLKGLMVIEAFGTITVSWFDFLKSCHWDLRCSYLSPFLYSSLIICNWLTEHWRRLLTNLDNCHQPETPTGAC